MSGGGVASLRGAQSATWQSHICKGDCHGPNGPRNDGWMLW